MAGRKRGRDKKISRKRRFLNVFYIFWDREVTGSELSPYNYKKLMMVNGIILLKQTNGWLNQAPDKDRYCITTVYIKTVADKT